MTTPSRRWSTSANAANWVKAYAAASCALAGRLDCARRIAKALTSEAPHFYAEAILRKEPYRNPADLEHLAEGFRKSGPADRNPAVRDRGGGGALLPDRAFAVHSRRARQADLPRHLVTEITPSPRILLKPSKQS